MWLISTILNLCGSLANIQAFNSGVMAGYGNNMAIHEYGVHRPNGQETQGASIRLQQQVLGSDGLPQYNQDYPITQQTHMPFHQNYPSSQQMHERYDQDNGAQVYQPNSSLFRLDNGRVVDLNDPRVQQRLRQARAQEVQQQLEAAMATPQNQTLASQSLHSQPRMMQPQNRPVQIQAASPIPMPPQQAGYNPAGSFAPSAAAPYAQLRESHQVQYSQHPQHPQQQQVRYPTITNGNNMNQSAAQSQSPSKHTLTHTSRPNIVQSQMFPNGLANINGSPAQRQVTRHTSTPAHPITSNPQSNECIQPRPEAIQGHPPTSSAQYHFTRTGTKIYTPQPQRKMPVPQLVSGHRRGQPALQVPSYSSPPRMLYDQGGRIHEIREGLVYSSNGQYSGNTHEQQSLAPTQMLSTLSPPDSTTGSRQRQNIEEFDLTDTDTTTLPTKRQKYGQKSLPNGPAFDHNEHLAHEGLQNLHNATQSSPIVIASGDHAAVVEIQDDDIKPLERVSSPSAEHRLAELLPTKASGSTEITSSNNTAPFTPQQTPPRYESLAQKQDAQKATMAGMPPDLFCLFVNTSEPDVDRWLISRGYGGLIHRQSSPLVQDTEGYRQSFEAADAFVQGLDEMRRAELEDFCLAADI